MESQPLKQTPQSLKFLKLRKEHKYFKTNYEYYNSKKKNILRVYQNMLRNTRRKAKKHPCLAEKLNVKKTIHLSKNKNVKKTIY